MSRDPNASPTPLPALLELVALDDLPRTGWVLRGVPDPESVAGHSLGVAHLVLALAPRVEPAVDLGRCLAMALVHDAPEAASGDLPAPAAEHLPPGAKAAMEAGLARRIVAPLGEVAHAAWEEYAARETREARLVHGCDRLQLGVRLLAYRRAGRRGLGEFEGVLRGADLSEFAPLEALRRELLDELGRDPRP